MIIELVSKDLRILLDNIPFSHMLTIHDLMRGHSLASFASKCYDVYRLGALAINPVGAVLRELRDLSAHQALRYPADEIKTWLLQSYVKQVAYYAIELYSGALTLSDRPTAEYITKYSRTDLERRALPAEEPLRLLVVGQVKAGKSSLINALFGELRAMTDVLPLTSGITPYVLERDEAGRMIVLDSAGYAGPTADQGFDEAEAELLRSDLILLVCSATNAARHADRQLLNNINALFQRRPDLIAPPLLVVLTHVDQLRPLREWDPPYNIAQPQRPKEQAIRGAMEATAEDLGIDASDVIAVNAQPEQIYNIEEGVIPAILGKLDHAQRVQYLRCLRELKREDHWNRLREQAWKAGRILLDAGARMAAKTVKRLGNEDRSAGSLGPRDVHKSMQAKRCARVHVLAPHCSLHCAAGTLTLLRAPCAFFFVPPPFRDDFFLPRVFLAPPISSNMSERSKPNNCLIFALSEGMTRLLPTAESSSTRVSAKAATSERLRPAGFISLCA